MLPGKPGQPGILIFVCLFQSFLSGKGRISWVKTHFNTFPVISVCEAGAEESWIAFTEEKQGAGKEAVTGSAESQTPDKDIKNSPSQGRGSADGEDHSNRIGFRLFPGVRPHLQETPDSWKTDAFCGIQEDKQCSTETM